MPKKDNKKENKSKVTRSPTKARKRTISKARSTISSRTSDAKSRTITSNDLSSHFNNIRGNVLSSNVSGIKARTSSASVPMHGRGHEIQNDQPSNFLLHEYLATTYEGIKERKRMKESNKIIQIDNSSQRSGLPKQLPTILNHNSFRNRALRFDDGSTSPSLTSSPLSNISEKHWKSLERISKDLNCNSVEQHQSSCCRHIPYFGCVDRNQNILRLIGPYGHVNLNKTLRNDIINSHGIQPTNRNADCESIRRKCQNQQSELYIDVDWLLYGHVRPNVINVLPEKKPWQITELEGYDPFEWQVANNKAKLADFDISSNRDTLWFCFNAIDKSSIVNEKSLITFLIDRRSYCGRYNIGSDGRPLNPRGRQGIKGRGFLARWGPNHIINHVVVRLNYNDHQFIAIRSDCSRCWLVPENKSELESKNTSNNLKRRIMKDALHTGNYANWVKIKQFLEDINACRIYRGYLEDIRNTDNAWLETTVMCWIDKGCGNFTDYEFNPTSEIKWISLNYKNLLTSHRFIISKVVDYLQSNA